MDIFIRHVPVQATDRQLADFFNGPLSECGITVFHPSKMRDKPLAIITVLDPGAGQRFLELYGVPFNAPRHVRAKKPLLLEGQYLLCTRSRNQPSDVSVRSLAYEASQQAAKASTTLVTQGSSQKRAITRFAVVGVQCGTWDFEGKQLCFLEHFAHARPGSIHFGRSEAAIVLHDSESEQSRIDIRYHDAEHLVFGTNKDPSVTFSLACAPKFYSVAGDALSAALIALTIGIQMSKKQQTADKARQTGITRAHSEIAGVARVYRVQLADSNVMTAIKSLIGRNKKAPPAVTMNTTVRQPGESLQRSFARLDYELTDTSRLGGKPFGIRYQLARLATNGVLPPRVVLMLIPQARRLLQEYGLDATTSALRRFHRQVPLLGPNVEAHDFSQPALEEMLAECAANYHQHAPDNPYEISKRYKHINLVHRVVVTPTAIHLEGPEPEPTNRVLRQYSTHTDHFIRVIFQDEDGMAVRYDPRASQHAIYHERFKDVLDKTIIIAGRAFSFLGFSHSSLRSQSCWFQAPIATGGILAYADHILSQLGDFSHIRIPAKCAARIGQNFTDTNATIDLHSDQVGTLAIVERNGRDFSDGVGTISRDLLQDVWRVYGTRRLLKPTVLQIRFQGAKGVVSLDTRLHGRRLMLRSNMKKFETSSSWNLEVCGAAFRPLPMILNRQLIKILEDLGVGADAFLELQKTAVDELRHMTLSSINTSLFLETLHSSVKAANLPSLVKLLGDIELDYHQDPFIYRVVEIAVVSKLRDIKYRGRIPVSQGKTLYGIMDETGYLREGEVFVAIESGPEGGRTVMVQDRMVVTRSPAMHPGDVQVVKAVNVPADSPLQSLSNVIAFSQHGARDLPSQLSGGDLDGDLYHVIHDLDLMPTRTCVAADYHRVTPVELDRAVDRKDMSDFFVKFMETDQLGMLSNVHVQLADQYPQGTFHPDCIKLAETCSTAVDYSKTGIAVDITECPRYNRCRPDFMAPSPRVFVSEKGEIDFEDEESREDDAFAGLDAERRGYQYYESQKVLGCLYRQIDERVFVERMQQQHRIAYGSTKPTQEMMQRLLDYVKQQAEMYGILYQHHEVLARDIRAGYEDSLLDILYNYEPTPYSPLTEAEVFAGTILGRLGGAQGKPLRELSQTMRERFETVAEYTVMRIVKGDEAMHAVEDLDELYNEREFEALPRAIACLAVGVTEAGWLDRQVGELKSYKYVAAGVCLKELVRYRLTTFGLRGPLPQVSR